MDTIKSIVKQCLCLTFLIAAACKNIKKYNLPRPPILKGQEYIQDHITISSRGRLVCIGSNNTIISEIAITDQATQRNKGIPTQQKKEKEKEKANKNNNDEGTTDPTTQYNQEQEIKDVDKNKPNQQHTTTPEKEGGEEEVKQIEHTNKTAQRIETTQDIAKRGNTENKNKNKQKQKPTQKGPEVVFVTPSVETDSQLNEYKKLVKETLDTIEKLENKFTDELDSTIKTLLKETSSRSDKRKAKPITGYSISLQDQKGEALKLDKKIKELEDQMKLQPTLESKLIQDTLNSIAEVAEKLRTKGLNQPRDIKKTEEGITQAINKATAAANKISQKETKEQKQDKLFTTYPSKRSNNKQNPKRMMSKGKGKSKKK